MNKEEFGGVVRAVLSAGVGFATAKGWFAGVDSETLQALVVAGSTLAVAWWSTRAKRARA